MDKVIQLKDWPQPTVVAEPAVCTVSNSLVLRYNTQDDAVVIITFPMAYVFTFGAPNDEALGGHPLGKNGLQFYSVHRVDESSWIQELARRNSIHPRHDQSRFLAEKVHYIFTFQDQTLECIAMEGQFWKPEIVVSKTGDEADEIWRTKIGAEQPRRTLRR